MEAYLLEQLTEKIFVSDKSILKGFKRYRVKNKIYPVVVRDKNAVVDGLILRDIDNKLMELLVAYEGM